jgi:hypothetical protein
MPAVTSFEQSNLVSRTNRFVRSVRTLAGALESPDSDSTDALARLPGAGTDAEASARVQPDDRQ